MTTNSVAICHCYLAFVPNFEKDDEPCFIIILPNLKNNSMTTSNATTHCHFFLPGKELK
jgi:hypothetical protein